MSRQAFEEWADDQGFILKTSGIGDDPCYLDVRARSAWDGWQAATNAALERAAEVCDKKAASQKVWSRKLASVECSNAIRALKDEK